MVREVVPKLFKNAAFEEPDHPVYNLIAANGAFLVRKTRLFDSVTESPLIGLEEQHPALTLRFGKVPKYILELTYGFFLWAWHEWQSEAIVVLFFDPDTRKFTVEAPEQKLQRVRLNGRWHTRSKISYGHVARPANMLKLGDAHSHGDIAAFFSAADDEDDTEDGLKIVMGDMDRAEPSVRVSFVASRTRFHLKPELVLEDFRTPIPPDAAWINRVTCEHVEIRNTR